MPPPSASVRKQAGVPCDTIHVLDVQPYGVARTQRTIRSCAWQCDEQGTDVHKSSGVGCSVSTGRSLGDGSLAVVLSVLLAR